MTTAPVFETSVACVAGVERGRGNFFGAREGESSPFSSSLLPRAWSRALIPFPFPFERLPRRLKRQSLSAAGGGRRSPGRSCSTYLRNGSWVQTFHDWNICLFVFIQELEEIGQKNINEYTKLLEEHQHILEEVKQLEDEISKASEWRGTIWRCKPSDT